VHGAIDLYAAMASLKADYEAQGAEVILADAGDYSQGTVYVSVHKGADAVTMMNATGLVSCKCRARQTQDQAQHQQQRKQFLRVLHVISSIFC